MEKIDFYSKVSAILKDCEKEVINLIKDNGGEIELPVNDDNLLSLVLPCYDINGDTYNTTITNIKVISSETGDWLELETENGCNYHLGRFADTPIIYIYDYIWALLHQ